MPVVGVAEILVKPSFTGAQQAISKELTGAADKAGESAGQSAGSKMGAALGKSLKVGAVAAGAAITGVLGTAIVKGFGRMSAIEQAQAKLIGLGNSAGDVKSIMDNALASVKGTAFGLDEAATVAAMAVASGIKPGAQLEGVLKTVADTATIAGASMSDMGMIFGSVAARGKLQGDDLMQLQARGVPVLQFLAKHYGITAQAASDMVSKGKVDFANFNAAMQENLGGAALASGNTTVGAFKNMNAALSRFGAALLKDVFPLIGPVFNKITAGLDTATSKVKPFIDPLASGLQDIYNLVAKGDFTGLFGLQEDSKVADIVLRVRDRFLEARTAVLDFWAGLSHPSDDWVRPLNDAIGAGAKIREAFSHLWAGLTLPPSQAADLEGQMTGLVNFGASLRATFDRLAPGILAVWDAFSPLHLAFQALAPVLPGIETEFGALALSIGGALATALPEVAFAMNSITAAVANVLAAAFPAVVSLFGLFGNVIATLAPLAANLVSALAPLVAGVLDKLGPLLSDLISGALPVVTTLLQSALDMLTPVIQGVTSLIENIPGGADTVATALALVTGAVLAYKGVTAATTVITKGLSTAKMVLTGVTEGYNAALGISTAMTRAQAAATAQGTAGFYAMKAAQIATMAVTRPLALAQMALNAVMNNNPIGKIIMLVSALVAGLVWFFTQTELGKQIVANVWSFIQDSIRVVGDWFTGTLVPAFQAAIQWVGDAFTWLNVNVVQPVFAAIGTAIQSVGDFFNWLWLSVIQPVFNFIGAAINFWWTNVVMPVFNFVSAAIQAVGGFFSWLYNDILSPIFQLAGALIAWWWNNMVMPVFNSVIGFIRDSLGTVFTWLYENIVKPVFDAIGATIDWIGGVFSWLYTNVVQPVFDAIGNAIKWVSDNVIQPIVDGWNLWFGVMLPAVMNWLYNNVVKPVFDAIGNAINWVWQNVILPVFQAVQNTVNAIGSAFDWLYKNAIKPAFDGIGSAISWVWDNIIKPVFDFISDAVQNKVPAAFEQGKKFIDDIWKGIQDIVKAPVKFVVQTVLNDGLIGAFNNIAGFLGTQKLGLIQLPPGFAEGGYTGDGSKYQPAGVVHAGEFVFTKAQTARAGVRNLYALASMLNGYAEGGLVSPLDSWVLSQGYKGDAHNGIDMAAPEGTPIHAPGPGRVSFAGWGFGGLGGNEMHIDLVNGLQVWLAHQSRFAAGVGDMVKQGQTVGYVGQTGAASGPHLHYMVLHGGWPNYTDPTPYLTGGGEAGGGAGFNPVAAIIDGLMGQFKAAFPQGGFMIDLIGGVAKNVVQGVSDFIDGIFGGKKPDNSKGDAEGGIPHLFRDQGGALPEGLSMVLNRTGSPEWVFNRQQLAALDGAVGGRGGDHYHLDGLFGFDPDELLDRVETRKRDALAMEGIY